MCFPYVCLSMPCALLLLSVSPPLTCSQSPGLCVSLVSPVSCLVHLCLCLPCVVTCLFPCLVLVLPGSRHVLSLCLFVYAMCPLVVVSVSTPHLFPISRVVCVIGFTCVLLFPVFSPPVSLSAPP